MDESSVAGRAFPPLSSREVGATLVLGSESAEVHDAAGTVIARARRDALKWEPPMARLPRRVSLPCGTLFESTEIGAMDRLSGGGLAHRLHRSERFSARLVLFVAAALLGAVAVWRFALPALVTVAVALTPEPLERAIDRGTLQALDRTTASESDLAPDRQAEIRTIFQRLLDELPSEELEEAEFRLFFRDTPALGPNAFALPNGTIVLTDQLVTTFPDEDVIAGVLAHEIGHVVERHGLTQLYRSLGVYVLVALIAGDTGPILEDVLLEGNVVLSLSFSRAHERAADAFALRLADAAGYDPAGLLAFFEAQPDAGRNGSGWMSTHPSSGDRIDAIRAYLDAR